MTPSLRKLLADSHVSTVAVAVLLLVSFGKLLHALLILLPSVLDFLLTAIAIHGLPSLSFTVADRLMLTPPLAGLFKAFAGFWPQHFSAEADAMLDAYFSAPTINYSDIIVHTPFSAWQHVEVL